MTKLEPVELAEHVFGAASMAILRDCAPKERVVGLLAALAVEVLVAGLVMAQAMWGGLKSAQAVV